jgi:hypothetical protein
MEDAIEKSKGIGDLSRGVCSQVLEEYIYIAYSKLKLIFKNKKVCHVPSCYPCTILIFEN